MGTGTIARDRDLERRETDFPLSNTVRLPSIAFCLGGDRIAPCSILQGGGTTCIAAIHYTIHDPSMCFTLSCNMNTGFLSSHGHSPALPLGSLRSAGHFRQRLSRRHRSGKCLFNLLDTIYELSGKHKFLVFHCSILAIGCQFCPTLFR